MMQVTHHYSEQPGIRKEPEQSRQLARESYKAGNFKMASLRFLFQGGIQGRSD
jgi:hypothetical protein